MYSLKHFLPVKNAPLPWIKIIFWVLRIALLIFLTWYLLARKKDKKPILKKSLPPLEEAIQSFRELDGTDYLKQNNSKEYYSKLTNIVKRYLDREVTKDALESTTDELLLRLIAYRDRGPILIDTHILRDL